ncbi:MAG: hypothetical protein LBC78_00495, partial [Oscillospiraceae bacterium]|nr:hypothetical protein [Oscillospiraceae bacterium]
MKSHIARARRGLNIIKSAADAPGARSELAWLRDNRYLAEREFNSASAAVLELRRFRGEYGAAKRAAEEYQARVGAADEARIARYLSALAKPLSERAQCLFLPALRLEIIAAIGKAAETPKGNQQTIADGVTSLRFLSGFDPTEVFEGASAIDRALREASDGVYAAMDKESRARYRRIIADRALALRRGEGAYARELVREAEKRGVHVGSLFMSDIGVIRSRVYIAANALLTLWLCALVAAISRSGAAAALALIPASEIVKTLTDHFARSALPRGFTPRLELRDGIPETGRTLAVISALVPNAYEASALARLLEEYWLSNRDCGDNLTLGLLCDLPEGARKVAPGDGEIIGAARAALKRLNAKYGERFFLFYRDRVRCERDGVWRPWERKRGAIIELCRFLRGKTSGIIAGGAPREVKFLITLDADTRLTPGSARRMAGAMLHPSCRCEIDEKRRLITRGHGILQPRIVTALSDAAGTEFARLTAGEGGFDPYGGGAPELYDSLCGASTFFGKGILDIDAAAACLDGRFRESALLSHDILEGAILRCGYLGSVELTDGHPQTPGAYYSRQSRWVRGDWQNAGWIFFGGLPAVDRFKLLDNLRRSLLPIATAAAFLAGALSEKFAAPAALAALAMFMGELIGVFAKLARPRALLRRYFSFVPEAADATIARCFARALLLPCECAVNLRAVGAALWRTLVSRRRLLEWTTAAQAGEKRAHAPGRDILRWYSFCAPGLACALTALLFTRRPPAAAAAACLIASPLYLAALNRLGARKAADAIPGAAFLRGQAKLIWRFFERYLTEEDNWLPPDNLQTEAEPVLARRTSPTNIGLALASAHCAGELGLAARARAAEIINNALRTLEALPKWRGHPYNWYDTETLEVMPPRFVSTVDNGNLAACLTLLREGLYEWGEADLALRADKLYRDMDFGIMYDERRKLLRLGWDDLDGEFSESCYDLFASENVTASYIAISRGQIPGEHWGALSRAERGQGGYRGCASWTGTMFEYLMPALFLPLYKNSLMEESARFCVYAHKRAARSHPWGASESAYSALDAGGAYRYKAHGAPRLALRRGAGEDDVVAPYASFLALAVDPAGAVGNLLSLQKLGAAGQYGFYDAVDYTRSGAGGAGESVRTFMAHHLGMSLLAITNALCGNLLRRRFMADAELRAHADLLRQRVPRGGIAITSPKDDVPKKQAPSESSPALLETTLVATPHPPATLLRAGQYSVIVSASGRSRSEFAGKLLARADFDFNSLDCGMLFFLKTADKLIPLQAAPFYDPQVSYRAVFGGGECRLYAECSGVEACVTVRLSAARPCELREITVTSDKEFSGEVFCYFEPVLERESEYRSHPAFSKLSIETLITSPGVVVSRRPKNRESAPVCALVCDRAAEISSSREAALGRGGILALESALAQPIVSCDGAALDPCVLSKVQISGGAGEAAAVRYALAAAFPGEDPLAAAQEALEAGCVCRDALSDGALRLGLEEGCAALAAELLPRLIAPPYGRRLTQAQIAALSQGVNGLWSLGISGDYPIAACVAESGCGIPYRSYIECHALLRECGVKYDLVFLSDDAGDYVSLVRETVMEELRALGREQSYGARGGVFCCENGERGELVLARAALILGQEQKSGEPPVHLPVQFLDPPRETPRGDYDGDGSFVFECGSALPKNAWSHILANERFGAVVTECGGGFMWRDNAREFKITPWTNDSLSLRDGERITLDAGGGALSVFGADGSPCRAEYGFGFARWEKRARGRAITTTMFVPPDQNARVLIIEGAQGGRLSYRAELCLSDGVTDGGTVVTSAVGNAERGQRAILAENPYNRDFAERGAVAFVCSAPFKVLTASRAAPRADGRGGMNACAGAPACASFEVLCPEILVIAVGDERDAFELSEPLAALASLKRTREYWNERVSVVRLESPDEALNRYMNGWAVYQTIVSRLYARASLYQCGGAYGFRDQLQDTANLAPFFPELAREHILKSAARQYTQGDVSHWWHPGTGQNGRGVRTRCSDDLLWLPYAALRYAETAGGCGIWDERAPYLVSPPLAEREGDRYEDPDVSEYAESVYEHCARALELVIERGYGEHGLCLIGGGDWNDGMNLVGHRGRGESVWLTWFFSRVAEDFAHVARGRGDAEREETFENASAAASAAANCAWDGAWFLRGYYDDGEPLGSRLCAGCKIDSIAQSFAALGGGERAKTEKALDSALKRLFDRERGVIKLFDPPFGDDGREPGYIRGYSPGFRENGGQYTHGAAWLAMGLYLTGRAGDGWEVLRAICPRERDAERYRAEPFVIAADVYSNAAHSGRGGWTWSTGASG